MYNSLDSWFRDKSQWFTTRSIVVYICIGCFFTLAMPPHVHATQLIVAQLLYGRILSEALASGAAAFDNKARRSQTHNLCVVRKPHEIRRMYFTHVLRLQYY